MKKICFLLLYFVSITLFSQVTTSPGTPTINDEITITLNTTGTELENYSGDIYAHTGVTVDGTQWENVIGSWGNNSTQPKFTKTAANSYTFTITNNVYDFYNVDNAKTISEINLVARADDGSKQTRPDIHIEIFSADLNIQITSPNNDSVFDNNTTHTITAEATIAANLELLLNNTSIETIASNKIISKEYTFTTTGQHIIKAVATDGTTTKEQEITVYVKTPTVTETKPAGAKNGITFNNDGSVTFVLLAPQKNDVFLIGDFNNWALHQDYQLKKDGDYFWITLTGLDANTEYAYQYFIDYDKKVADPYAKKVLDQSNDQYISATNYPNLKSFPTKASGIVSTFKQNTTSYTWQTSSFTKPAKEELVIYELLVRDFSSSDSYQAIIDKLDYLETLGINALQLMPVNEFEGNDSWGYNVSHFFALDKAYGTQNKFKELIDKCHAKGIAVILDVVFNHAYSQNPLVQMYDFDIAAGTTSNNPFFNDNHNFQNGALQFGFDFNHEASYTQQYFKDVMSYWIEEYKIDGFRLDFTKGFTNTFYPTSGDQWGNNYNQERIDRLTDYANHVWNNHDNGYYMILEHLTNNDEEKALANAGMMLWGKMTEPYNQNTMGYNSNSDISWGYYKNRDFNDPNLVAYMESHDEERLMYKNLQFGNTNGGYSVKNLNTALKRMEAAGAFYFTIPGPKMIWQFGELGYDISIDENGRTGRKPVKWEYFDVPQRKSIYDTWSKLIALKKGEAIFNSTEVTLTTGNTDLKSIHLTLSSATGNAIKHVTIIGNFGVTEQAIDPKFQEVGDWFELLNGNKKITVANVNTPISLAPGEFKIYADNPTSLFPTTDDDNDGVLNEDDQCPNTPEGTVVNVNGCEVFTLPANNFALSILSETCRTSNNGSISITAKQNLNYNVSISGGTSSTESFTSTHTFNNLAAGTYTVCITVDGQAGYEICFNAIITEPEDIQVLSRVETSSKSLVLNLYGSKSYTIDLNGTEYVTTDSEIELPLKSGANSIKVVGDKLCQGKFEKTFYFGNEINAFPNPANNIFNVYLGEQQSSSTIQLFALNGKLIYRKVANTTLEQVDISKLSKGIYILNIVTKNESKTLKILKK